MGTYTEYRIETEPRNWFSQETDEELQQLTGYDLSNATSGFWTEELKWYGNHPDLIEFTKKHPDVFITLEGIAEDRRRWQKRFNNGKMIGERQAYRVAHEDPQPIWGEWGEDAPTAAKLRSANDRLTELYELLGVNPGKPDSHDKAVAIMLGYRKLAACSGQGWRVALGGDVD